MKEIKNYIKKQQKNYPNKTFKINEQAIKEIGSSYGENLESTAKTIGDLINIGVINMEKLILSGVIELV